MALSDRLRERVQAADGAVRLAGVPDQAPEGFQALKGQLHRTIIDKLDLQAFDKLPDDARREQLRSVLAAEVSHADIPLNAIERERMNQELLDELIGLGPLEPLLSDTSISDILVNNCSTVYIERHGRLELTPVRFADNEHLMRIINRIVSRVGRRVDETSPMVDARLPDGSRVNAIVPPLALDGAILSIRRFGVRPLLVRDLVGVGALSREAVGFLGACVKAKSNLLISGGTGAGKTTLLNALSAFIPEGERVVTIEDSAELKLQQRHVVRLETRPPNIEGKGEIVARDLVRNSLRMRPDRIIIGEVRGGEVLDMLQAMNTGHEGSMTTVHANTSRDALSRIEAMFGMAGVQLTETAIRQTIARALHIVVQANRGVDGRRRITSIAEITGTEGNVITMQEIFRFEQRGVDATGQVVGEFVSTGIRPRITSRLAQYGADPEALASAMLGS
jgi:pilus assembly protein CpaF